MTSEPSLDKESRDFDFDPHLETGFQLATFQGPLCAEPVDGMAYFVEDLQIDMAGIEKEIGMFVFYFGTIYWNDITQHKTRWRL